MSNWARTVTLAIAAAGLLASAAGGRAAVAAAGGPAVSASSWRPVTRMADPGPRHYAVVRDGTFNGRKIAYTAGLAEMLVRDQRGELAGSVFVTEFVARPAAVPANRPVVFLFNGGPGGSSNTLLFGAMGPQRLARFDAAAQADPATPIVANPDAILDVADLVFIDAPETGFGRPLPGADPTAFRSDDGDANAFAQVILRWLSSHRRIGTPVYLAGESYGSIRAVLLARDLLAATPRVEPAGLILISQALSYNGPDSAAVAHVADPVRAINSLPDVAALAWYHGRIDNRGRTLEQAVGAAQAYALGEYGPAMLAGNRLAAADRMRIAARLAALTGLPAETWIAGGLRLRNMRRELLADRGLALGQFDGRETEPLQGVVNDDKRDFKTMMSALTTASERLAAETFHATGLPPYRSIVDNPYAFEKTWTFITAPAPGADIVLREQMAANPRLRLLVTQGVFDTTTPMGETDYLLSQIAPPVDRTVFARFAGGHMLYADDAERRAFLATLRAFVGGRPIPSREWPQPTPGTVSRP